MEIDRQCRICFEYDNSGDMLSPCHCRGTSQYIHLSCLEDYLIHYPDHICRVCRQQIDYMSPFQYVMTMLLVSWILVLIGVSSADYTIKLFFLFIICIISAIPTFRNIVTPTVSMLILFLTFLLVSVPTYILLTAIYVLGGILSVVTLGLFIPIHTLLFIFTNLFLTVYTLSIITFFSSRYDIFTTSCLISFIIFVWALAIYNKQAMRYI